MKLLLYLIFILPVTNYFGQMVEGSISYKVELTDPITKEVNRNWQFRVEFNSKYTRVFKQHQKNNFEIMIVDKIGENALFLSTQEGYNSSAYLKNKDVILMYGSSNFGDTTVQLTDEYKKIKGFNCRKMVLDLGGQATATYWITEEIAVGINLPGTPLSFGKVALECVFEDPSITTTYNADVIEKKMPLADLFDMTIPDPYELIVPLGVYSLEEPVISDFDFLEYPTYPEGVEAFYALFDNMKPSDEKKGKAKHDSEDELEGLEYIPTLFIQFTVEKDGSLSNIDAEGGSDKENAAALNILQQMPKWTPAIAKGKTVVAEVMISVPIG